jgi:hypothetical protein
MHEQPLADVDLPIVREIGEALYAAALAADAHGGVWAGRGPGARARRTDGSRAKRRHGLRHPPLMALVALSALVLAAGIAAAGTLVGGIGITPNEWLSGKRAQPPAAITADQAIHLAILRRPRDPSWDVFASEDRAELSHGTFTGAAGADFGLSRRVRGLPSGAAWIVPGASRVCLIAYAESDAHGRPTPGTERGVVCKNSLLAVSGRMALFVTFPAKGGASRAELLAGVVPDGVSMVNVELARGASIPLAVHENVYLARLRQPAASVRFSGSSGVVKLSSLRLTPSHTWGAACARRGSDEICRRR